jgi:Zn-dependent M32 family carboxypeptidase
MSETLGSLCDKLTIVKLKQWHSEDAARLSSLAGQENQLKNEIDAFVAAAASGKIPVEKLTFAANKVYKKEGNVIQKIEGDIGEVFSQLAVVNCKLWHEQEKVYEFEKVPPEQKDGVVKQLALLNLERNQCIDRIDKKLAAFIQKLNGLE